MNTQFLTINKLGAYRESYELSNYIWNIVMGWNYFEKDTLGKQFVRSIDSVSANIAEGFCRFSKKDKIRFYYYSLGSVNECTDWNNKSFYRKLLTQEQHNHIMGKLELLPREINQLIKYTNLKLKY